MSGGHAVEPSFTDKMLLDIRAAEGPDGRLPMPDLSDEDIFPFEGSVQVRRIDDPVMPEPPRVGETGGRPCGTCAVPDANFLLVAEHWRLRAIEPSGMPVAMLLYPREHAELCTLSDERASELGVLMSRIEAAIKAIGGINEVHVNKWGDGSYHLHVWFFGRPEGFVQLSGPYLSAWDDVLPKRPESEWEDTHRRIVAEIEVRGGLTV